MAKRQTKNLTLASLRQKNKMYEDTFEVTIDGYSMKINKLWSPIKINELIMEFVTNLEQQLKTGEGTQISTAYLYLLFIRHFTSLNIPKDVSKQLEWLDELINTGYYSLIVEKLPLDQIEIVQNELQTALDDITNKLPLIQEELDKLDFVNEEVENIALPKAE
jgi:hypothetical protein